MHFMSKTKMKLKTRFNLLAVDFIETSLQP